MLERHEVLRSSFHWERLRQPVQVVHRRLPTVGLFLAFGALSFPLYDSLRYLEAISRPGTRDRARAWVEAQWRWDAQAARLASLLAG